ncbi:MAG: hypothetical protein WCP21_24355, partial [Armatimonadota bacterium]
GGAMRGKVYVALSSFTQPRTWRLKLSSMRINDISENPVIGPSGDEPYFVTVQFRSRFSTPGSTRVWRGNGPYEFASNLKIGANVDIPANMGQYDFANVQSFTIADGCRLQRPEVIGAMVLCLEHDFSPFSDINDLVGAAIDRGVAPALQRLVETRAIPLTPEATQQLINDSYNLGPQIMNSMQPSTWDIVSLLFNAGFDADDFVDYHGFLWLAADPEVEPLLQRPSNLPPKVHFGVLKDTRYEAGAEGPLIFSGGSVDSHAEHASYTVRGSLTLQP